MSDDLNAGASAHSNTGVGTSSIEGWSGSTISGEFHPLVVVQRSKASRGSSENLAGGETSAHNSDSSEGVQSPTHSHSDVDSDSESIAALREQVKRLETEAAQQAAEQQAAAQVAAEQQVAKQDRKPRPVCTICKHYDGEESVHGVTRTVVALPCCSDSACADCLSLFTTCPNKCTSHKSEFGAVVATAKVIVNSMPRFSRDHELKLQKRFEPGNKTCSETKTIFARWDTDFKKLQNNVRKSDLDALGCFDDPNARPIGKDADLAKGLSKETARLEKEIGEFKCKLQTLQTVQHEIAVSYESIVKMNAKRIRYSVGLEVLAAAAVDDDVDAELERKFEEVRALHLRERAAKRARLE
jgi:hypothetical protein